MQVNLNYIWAAMAVNFLLVYIVPKLIKKPTQIKVIDDTVLYLNSQKSFLLSSTIITGLVTYLAMYWVQSASTSSAPAKSPEF
jgi:hypothetical protein